MLVSEFGMTVRSANNVLSVTAKVYGCRQKVPGDARWGKVFRRNELLLTATHAPDSWLVAVVQIRLRRHTSSSFLVP